MSNDYIFSVLRPRSRELFDASNLNHRKEYAYFVKYSKWKDGCPYYLEHPFASIPDMINSKLLAYYLKRLIDDV